MRRAVLVAALTAALSVGLSAPALGAADESVVVRGTAFPSSDTYLTYFGCVDLFHADTRGPLLRITREDAAPAGRRSFGLLLPGTGTASGPVRRVDSVAETTVAGLSVRAPEGTTGVAYVWYAAPGLIPGQVWAGRADLTAPAGGWQYADATAASYSWTLYNAASRSPVRDGGTATIADFTAANGDGPGYLLAGFGCDGHDFAIDGLQYGSPGSVTTYDLEGISVATSMTADAHQVRAGESVTLTGVSLDVHGSPVAAPLVLEARPAGEADFRPVGEPVKAAPDGTVTVTVRPEATTAYRWFFPESGYADASWSMPVKVSVIVPKTGRR